MFGKQCQIVLWLSVEPLASDCALMKDHGRLWPHGVYLYLISLGTRSRYNGHQTNMISLHYGSH
jgi:hypothetical protein